MDFVRRALLSTKAGAVTLRLWVGDAAARRAATASGLKYSLILDVAPEGTCANSSFRGSCATDAYKLVMDGT